MPEEIVTTPPLANEPAPTDPPSAQPVIAPDRDAVIKKYEAAYYEPVAEPVTQSTEPATPTPTIAEPTVQPELATVLQSLMAEVAGLKAQLTPKPEPVVTPPATEEDWLKLLSEGKKSEGEKALAAVLGPQMKREAVQEALQLMQAEREVTEFATRIKQDNADLMPMEAYIAAMANTRIQAAQAAGQINSPADYVKVYQTAVNAEIENARKLQLTLRGVGKQEAVTRTQVVASAQNVRPNAVNPTRDTTPAPVEPVLDPMQDYFAKRREQHARNIGLSAPQGR